MRKARFVVATLAALAVITPHLFAQEKTSSASKTPQATLKMQVVITEHEGEKKLMNLPYTFFLRAGDQGSTSPWTKVRMGSRVPVHTGKEGSMQYIDVGTNIDARAILADNGGFDVSLNLERSWVEGDVMVPAEKSASAPAEANSGQFKEPVIRQFRTELTQIMHDGQTIQCTQATDPLSGRILTVTVTGNVVK
jgi:hypothetical protein